MDKCGICFQEYKKKHFNQRYCSLDCKYKAKRRVQERYKHSDKGKDANQRWIKSERRKQNEKKYQQKPKAKEHARQRTKRYYQNHPEKYKENLERIKREKKWLTNHGRQIAKKAGRKYRRTEKGRQSIKNGNSRRRSKIKTGRVTIIEWKIKLKEFNHRCAKCRKKRKLEQDHIIPLSKGGKHEISNIQPLCRSCNAHKSNK